MKWVADRVALIVWTIGFVAIIAGSVAGLMIEHSIDDNTLYGYVFLVLAFEGLGMALMGTGLLLILRPRSRR